jgi:hypothetical protein
MYLYVLVLSWQRLDHLFNGSGQVFRVLFHRKFGVAEAQHAAAARRDVEQRALFGALHLQLQIFFTNLNRKKKLFLQLLGREASVSYSSIFRMLIMHYISFFYKLYFNEL